mgnify:CR=1 FL=1
MIYIAVKVLKIYNNYGNIILRRGSKNEFIKKENSIYPIVNYFAFNFNGNFT